MELTGSNRAPRAGFTLVELLVVVALMGVMMGLAIPAFQAIGRGGGMRAGVSQLASTLSLARQYAITHRQTTYVVFPDDEPTLYNSNPTALNQHRYKAYRCFGVFAVTNQANFAANLGGAGRYVAEWVYLPQGVIFDASKATSNPGDWSIFADAALVANIPFPDDSNRKTMFAIKFLPDGRARGSTINGYRVDVAEGWMNVVTNTGTWSWDFGTKPNGMKTSVQVSPITGGVSVDPIS